jgi:GT2 family glycosyltransferase
MTVFISVIVPTCQRNDLLRRCLDRLAPGAQELAFDLYEVIVTDDGRTTTAAATLGADYPWAKWVEGPKRGPAANRNNGAKQALGQWLAFIDDDCLPERNWLSSIFTQAQSAGAEVLEGKTITPDNVDNPLLRGIENSHGGLYWSCNLSVRRQTFEELGGFDEDFLEAGGEDMEFAWRFRAKEIPARFCPEALVLHPARPLTWRALLWRSKMSRWMMLYYHKTGQATPLSQSSLKALLNLAQRETTNQLRRTWHLISKDPSYNWRTRWFDLIWSWIAFPVVLPYMLLWELKFRKLLTSKQPQ